MAKSRPRIVLHQFPISHFCEKVRLGLLLKGLEYEAKNHLPMLHALTVRRLSGQQMVPVLEIDGKIIPDSNAILRYLDQRHPDVHPFFPKERKKLHEMNEFIQRTDVGVGVHLRRLFYHHIIPNRKLFCELLAGRDYNLAERTAFRAIAPAAAVLMKKGMKITDETARRSKDLLERTLDELDRKIARRKHFFGNTTSAADLTVAALFAPLVQPAEHPMDWPKDIPAALDRFRKDNIDRPVSRWVKNFYANLS